MSSVWRLCGGLLGGKTLHAPVPRYMGRAQAWDGGSVMFTGGGWAFDKTILAGHARPTGTRVSSIKAQWSDTGRAGCKYGQVSKTG